MKVYIKNMVCNRCEMAVTKAFENLKLPLVALTLGEATLSRTFSSVEKQGLATALRTLGFELLEDKTTQTIEKIKNRIIDLVHHQNDKLKVNFSTCFLRMLKSFIFKSFEAILSSIYLLEL